MLQIGENQIAQSATINRYIARKYGFAGCDETEEGVENVHSFCSVMLIFLMNLPICLLRSVV